MASFTFLKADIQIFGVVQGVGFRPFVARLAEELGVAGSVKNVRGHVEITAFGGEAALAAFAEALQNRAPAHSRIVDFSVRTKPVDPDEPVPAAFAILASCAAGEEQASLVLPDLPTCDACLAELFRPGDSRFRNAFISCTDCGPRFSIMRGLPYDREQTSMRDFALCEHCATQYNDRHDRRFHAETVCCNDCGPRLRYVGREAGGTLEDAVHALTSGGIIALKGIGGFHFACSPYSDNTVLRLRALKGREHKPFAVMFPDLASLKAHCDLSEEERALLESDARPIVLLKRKASAISPAVFGASDRLGAFLPYTPLQHLILRETGPLIMTSANVSSLPIIKDSGEMVCFLKTHDALRGVVDHDRAIVNRCDDSVVSVLAGAQTVIRRARGYVPGALSLPGGCEPLIALGAQEKGAFCLWQRDYAYPSAELGSLDNRETWDALKEQMASMEALLHIQPRGVVCDLHPGYTTTDYAKTLGLPLLQVQHHHAHIASVMAEHRIEDPVLGVALDGTGYGADGTVWGGEFLLVSTEGFTRVAHLKPVAFLGSDESVRQCWKSAACMLRDAGLPARDGRDRLVYAALEQSIHTIRSSSMGRVFDAVSALLGICDCAQYEAQGAIELEYKALEYREINPDIPPFAYEIIQQPDGSVIDFACCIRALAEAIAHGDDVSMLAYRFHRTVAHAIEAVLLALSETYGIRKAALSGGVFMNRILSELLLSSLARQGFTVYRNRLVPTGDGGISLGQAQVALWTWGKGENTCVSQRPEG